MSDVGYRPVEAEISAALAREAAVVTGTAFAAQWLTHAEDHRRRAAGATAWQAATILSWDSWLKTLWQAAQLRGLTELLLLNPTQERALATECAAEAQGGEAMAVAAVAGLGELALAAWHQLVPYGASDSAWQQIRPGGGDVDAEFFRRWAAVYAARCRKEQLLSPALLEREVARLIPRLAAAEGSVLPREVVLVGSSARSPARQSVMVALEEAGVALAEIPHSAPAAKASLVCAADAAAEMQLAARWLKARLAEKPAARLAVLTCSLDERRTAIEQALREQLAPEDAGIFGAERPACFEVAGGTPLVQQAAVRVALDLLSWLDGPLALESVSAVLLSPAFGSQGREREAVAAFDAYELRNLKLLQPELSIASLRQLLRRSPRAGQLTALQGRVTSLAEAQDAVTDRRGDAVLRSPGDWAERIHRVLRDAGWNASRSGGRYELQLRRRWESSLDQLASLDFDDRRLSFAEARQALLRVVERTRFTADWTAAPVQVLDAGEAVGCTFDAVWVLGAGDRTWLPRPTVSPLLPPRLARELGLPGASLETHRREAGELTRSILTQAREVVFSYSQEVENGEQRPSPYLDGLGLSVVEGDDPAGVEAAPEVVALDRLPESFAPALPQGTRVHGGTDILRTQAACSFQAFALYRLASTDLEEPILGWGPKERGTVLHRALETVWQQLGSRDGLLAQQAKGGLMALTQSAVDEAFDSMRAVPSSLWEERYLATERRRLQQLLVIWLEAEAQRKEEFTVRNRELQLKDKQVGPLLLTVKVDRIDEVGDGLLLIDYKSGGVSASMWSGERLDQPQLPLYAVLQQEPVAGVAFASLRVGDSRFLGYGPDMNAPKSLPFEDLRGQLPVWRAAITALAEDFASGRADVDPKEFPGTCQYCGQRLLCRIDPPGMDGADEPQDQPSAGAPPGAELG